MLDDLRHLLLLWILTHQQSEGGTFTAQEWEHSESFRWEFSLMSIPSCWSSELDLPLTTTRLSRTLSCLGPIKMYYLSSAPIVLGKYFDDLNISIRRCACPISNLSCTPIMRASSSTFFSSHTLVDAYTQRWPQYSILDGSWTSWRFSSKKHVFLAPSLLWLPQLSSPHKFFPHNTEQVF